MSKSEIIRIATRANATVVQLPERQYPGIVIQGDSLRNLNSLVQEARSQIGIGRVDECADLLEEVAHLLEGYVYCYNEATDSSRGREAE